MNKKYQVWTNAESNRRLKRIATAIIGSSELAEEIVQEAYLRLLENKIETIENPSAWLNKVTCNLALDQSRRRTRERQLLLLVTGLNLCEQSDGRHAAESRIAEIISCLLHVSDSSITAIVLLHVVFGMSYKDIASICGHSPTTCRQAASRALRKCFGILGADERYEDSAITDRYVQAVLEASMAPLIDSLGVTSPVSMYSVVTNHSGGSYYDDSLTNTSGTRQILVLTATGVQWALVLNGIVLCLLGNSSVFCTGQGEVV